MVLCVFSFSSSEKLVYTVKLLCDNINYQKWNYQNEQTLKISAAITKLALCFFAARLSSIYVEGVRESCCKKERQSEK